MGLKSLARDFIKRYALAGIRTQVICLEGRDTTTILQAHELFKNQTFLNVINSKINA